eukprot:gnl/TRDRNA2_/TRDRNA2_160218_c1_seq2.p1 gnl/TRDRNA2_/TRDRNA2_160218_c1~~gnl/TRDRNA2_/TRDRNA2_160218_c1_seq2.p1  ORF type:complete len:255 (+),score=27.04 gnl/TRDRNA2_/TRDRNA2_160218_c1_seq2:74-766(+)
MTAEQMWEDYGSRSDVGYQKLFWLTSDNAIKPQRVKYEMSSCFGSKLGNRLDFNPGTYSLLHHNCNKFSSEAMRYLELPRFADARNKGYHNKISLSATEEESSLRRTFQRPVGYFLGDNGVRSTVSRLCQQQFISASKNCRRVGGLGITRKGDCPIDEFTQTRLRCYDWEKGKGKIAAGTGYNDPVNGKCGVPSNKKCSFASNPCRPGTKCVEGWCKGDDDDEDDESESL